MLSRFKHLLARLLQRDRVESDLDEEVQSFYDVMAARGAARSRFENQTRVKERVREEGWMWQTFIDTTVQDVRYGLRTIRKNPGFAAMAILSLALGLGANTAIFTLIDTVILRSMPVQDPERLFFIDNSGGKSGGSSGPPYPCFEILRDSNHYFSGMAAFSNDRFRASIDGTQEQVRGQYASGSIFQILGVGAMLGRTLTADDENVPVAVISHGMWERRFSRSPEVLGKQITLGQTVVTIVGVTPPGYLGLEAGSPVDITVPITLSTNNLRSRGLWWFSVIGRLRDGASPEQARSELDGYFHNYMNEIGLKGELKKHFSGIALVPANKGMTELRRRFSRPLMIVMTIVALVLLIGCANVANLLLARASARREEMAMRLAIGASRFRIFRQVLTEGLILAIAASAAGILFARWAVAALVSLLAGVQGKVVLEPHFDLRVVAFAAAVALLTCVLFSIAPAWHSVYSNGNRSNTEGRGQFRTGNALVVVQLMLSAILLCGASLFLRSLANLHELDPGFDRRQLFSTRVDAMLPRTPGKPTEEQIAANGRMWENLVAGLSQTRGSAVSASSMSPLSGRDNTLLMDILGDVAPPADRGMHVNLVSTSYFETLGVRLVAGRLFAPTDTIGSAKVVILSEGAAKARFGGKILDAIGKRVTFPGQPVTADYEIAGVVHDVRYESLRKTAEPMVYVPFQQALFPRGSALISIRDSIAGASATIKALREIAPKTIPGGFVQPVIGMEKQLEESLLQERLLSILATMFGGLALLLAAIGLYGVLSYRVIRRTREIGLRMAVGATRAAVVWLVLRDSIRLAAIGLALSIPAIWAARRFIESELFLINTNDPVLLSSMALLLLMAVAVAASLLPAWRASQADPLVSLRHE